MVDITAIISEPEEINVTIDSVGATELKDLTDIALTNLLNSQYLIYDSVSEQWKNTSGSVVWGEITGTLSNQTDLQSALDAKEDDLTFSTGLTRTVDTITVNNSEVSISASQVTDFDTEVANNSAVFLNTAKITNATHTGEVTGETSLTITSNVIDEDNLKLDESPTNDYVLTADSTKSGGMKWALSGGVTGPGDVIGPSSSVDNALTTFDSITGKLIKDSGLISEGNKIYQNGYATSYIKFNDGSIEIWTGGNIQASWN